MINPPLKEIVRLALPVALTYLGLMTMGLVDLIAVGNLGATATGAVGIGTSFFSWGAVLGIGLLAGMDYFVSKAYGAGNIERGLAMLGQGLWLSILMSVPVVGILGLFSFHLDWFHINPEVIPETGPYLRILAVSLPPFLVFSAYRNFLQAVNSAQAPMAILFAANVLNALLNYALVFGHFGLPGLGTEGSGLATLISRVWMMAAIAWYARRWYRQRGRRSLPILKWNRPAMTDLLRLGFPSGAQMTLEVGVFATSTTLAGRLTAQALAAHQIVLNIAAVTFMIPFGIGAATAVLVGQALGHQDERRAGRLGWAGVGLGVSFMTVSSLVLLGAGESLLHFYTVEPGVMQFATSLLLIAGLFQLSDGAQTVLTGALRGVADTRTPMFANLVGHWFLGLPLGVFLCFYAGWGLMGLWIGLAAGLTFVAGVLIWVWQRKTRSLGFAGKLAT